MLYADILKLFQLISGVSLIVSAAFMFLAVISTHPDRRRADVVPLGIMTAGLESLIGLALLIVYVPAGGSLVTLVISAGIMIASICLAFTRVYYLGLMRALFSKVRNNGC